MARLLPSALFFLPGFPPLLQIHMHCSSRDMGRSESPIVSCEQALPAEVTQGRLRAPDWQAILGFLQDMRSSKSQFEVITL